MKILSHKLVRREDCVSVDIRHDRRTWALSIRVVDGKVAGNFNKVATSRLTYFNYSEAIRQKHFEEIKKVVEKDYA